MVGKRNNMHGLGGTLLYTKWYNMIARCYNPKEMHYRWYGEKGIKVCPEWQGTEGLINFVKWSLENGYKKGLTIDRIDSDKDYTPDNCRYITFSENAKNKKKKIDNELLQKIKDAEAFKEPYFKKVMYFRNEEEYLLTQSYIKKLREFRE